MLCELETNCVSLERVLEYIKGNPQEAPWHSDDFQNPPNPNWPSEGKINFANYQTQYRPGLDLVLKGESVFVHPMHSVGIEECFLH